MGENDTITEQLRETGEAGESELEVLRTHVAELREELTTVKSDAHMYKLQLRLQEQEIRNLLNVVCDHPACTAAVVRRDDGRRECAHGHPAKWVSIALFRKVESQRDDAVAKLNELEITHEHLKQTQQHYAERLNAVTDALLPYDASARFRSDTEGAQVDEAVDYLLKLRTMLNQAVAYTYERIGTVPWMKDARDLIRGHHARRTDRTKST